MFNSEKLQRVLKLINYKMLYLLWFSPCYLYVCAYVIFIAHTYWHHMHFDRLKAKFPIHFQYWQESFKFTVSLFFSSCSSSSSSSSSLLIAIDIMSFSLLLCLYVCVLCRNTHDDIVFEKKNNKRMNEWMKSKHSKNCLSRLRRGILNKKIIRLCSLVFVR